MISTRQIQLHGGPNDGQDTIASHWTAIVDGNIYCVMRLDSTRFYYAFDIIKGRDKQEIQKVREWIVESTQRLSKGEKPRSLDCLLPIPATVVNAYQALIQNGKI